jgi:hypothetical protein
MISSQRQHAGGFPGSHISFKSHTHASWPDSSKSVSQQPQIKFWPPSTVQILTTHALKSSNLRLAYNYEPYDIMGER